jgi:glycolate dehydrogenase FAD-binding subunit
MTATPLLDAVRPVCPGARPGTPEDAFAGVQPLVVATPSGTGQVAALLAAVAPLGAAVGVRGGATKAGLGAPARALDLLVDTRGLDQVLEYDPGDLVVRAQAGVRLDALQARLAGHGQWLALDPPEPGATLGGIVAAAASGPRRHRYGAPRDLLIGATFVLADGTCARAGGRVVKNVAGYDLCKLLAGSLGTLALLTEVTFRLHPRPAASAVVTVPVAGGAVQAAVRTLHGTRLEPAAVELDADPIDGTGTLAVLFEGLPEAVDRQTIQAAALLGGDVGAEPPPWWGRPPWDDRSDGVPPEGRGLGLRIACAPAGIGTAVEALAGFSAGAARARVRGRAAVGVLEAAVQWPTDEPGVDAEALTRLRAALDRIDGTAVVTRLDSPPGSPAEKVTDGIDRWGPVRGLHLMRAVKDRFDPQHRLAPGRFVGGI